MGCGIGKAELAVNGTTWAVLRGATHTVNAKRRNNEYT